MLFEFFDNKTQGRRKYICSRAFPSLSLKHSCFTLLLCYVKPTKPNPSPLNPCQSQPRLTSFIACILINILFKSREFPASFNNKYPHKCTATTTKTARIYIKANHPKTHFNVPCMKSVLSVAVKMHRRCGNGVSAHKCGIKCYNSRDKTRRYASYLYTYLQNVCFDFDKYSDSATISFAITSTVNRPNRGRFAICMEIA